MENLEEVAKIAGKLVKTDGKISTTRFNRLYTALGYDKVGRSELKDYMREIQSDSVLLGIYNDSLTQEIDYNDVNGKLVSASQVRPDVSMDIIDREFNRASVRNYKKYQKEGAIQEGLSEMVASKLADTLGDIITKEPAEAKLTPVLDANATLIVGLSDWHIGATVKGVNGNTYNLAVAQERLDDFMEKTIQTIKANDVERVIIVHLGDYVEHVNMRNVNQAFDAEVDMAEQIATANRMLIDFIRKVAKFSPTVEVALIGGNHDRYQGNKKDAIYNDNIAYNMVDNLMLLDDYGVLGDNVTILDNRFDVYSAEFDVYGNVVQLVHGDFLKNTEKPKIPSLIKDHPIDYVMFGHYHSSKILQENGYATSIMVGSLQGNNTYSKQLNLPDSKASQTLILFNKADASSPVYMPKFL